MDLGRGCGDEIRQRKDGTLQAGALQLSRFALSLKDDQSTAAVCNEYAVRQYVKRLSVMID